uniref:Uncharacterized protein n=1 Tax=Arundo donax TaxID=35708 RepID=A0A0A9B2X9_ARUDO
MVQQIGEQQITIYYKLHDIVSAKQRCT